MRRYEQFREWRDGNFNVRRAHERWQIKGSFVASFFTEAEYDEFITAINDATTPDGYTRIRLFVEDSRATEYIYAFIECEPRVSYTNRATDTGIATPSLINVKVTITER